MNVDLVIGKPYLTIGQRGRVVYEQIVDDGETLLEVELQTVDTKNQDTNRKGNKESLT